MVSTTIQTVETCDHIIAQYRPNLEISIKYRNILKQGNVLGFSPLQMQNEGSTLRKNRRFHTSYNYYCHNDRYGKEPFRMFASC